MRSAIASRTNDDKDNPSELATALACAAKSELIRVCISLLLVMFGIPFRDVSLVDSKHVTR